MKRTVLIVSTMLLVVLALTVLVGGVGWAEEPSQKEIEQWQWSLSDSGDITDADQTIVLPEPPPNDPHWKQVEWLMDALGVTWWRSKWYYKRPGHCSVCGTKGHIVRNMVVGDDTGTIGYVSLCSNCGNLFSTPKKEVKP